MLIKNIELIGYKRFNLNQIHKLAINFTEKIQLILGTNGSGKSSLLKELSPLPASHQDYVKGGSKNIVIEYKGHIYSITSKFEGSQHHSCLKDNVELNLGGTFTVQKDIIYKEFGVTPDLHELMTGQTLFHQMSVAQRRYWFTLLSNTDYTYALSVFGKLKEKLRDVQGALKINQVRLINENKKLLDADQESSTRSYIEYLQKMKKELVEILPRYYVANKINKESAIKEYSDLESNRVMLKSLVYNKNRILKTINYRVEDMAPSLAKMIVLVKEIDAKSKDLQTKENLLKSLLESKITGLGDTIIQIESLTTKIVELKKIRPIDLSFNNVDIAAEAIEAIYDSVIQIVRDIAPNPGKTFNRESYAKTKELKESLDREVKDIETAHLKLINTIKSIDHNKEHNETTCPECKHVWSRGYNEADYLKYKNQLDSINTILANKTIAFKEATATLEAMTSYFVLLVQYTRITAACSALEPLWKYIEVNNIIYDTPSEIPYVLEKAKRLINIDKEIAINESTIANLNNVLVILESDKSKDLNYRQNEIATINEDLFQLMEQKRRIDNYINILNNLSDVSSSIDTMVSKLDASVNSVETIGETWIKQENYVYTNQLISLISAEVEKENTTILQIDRQKAITSTLENQNRQYETEIKALKILITELSPSEGLIAKGMQGFINVFISEINNIIKQIWLYPLELVLLNNDGDEQVDLDYKFALKINDETPIADINLASTAMKEVINLSFKIVCMRYLNMSDYPIFLDEFGASMDSAHRFAAITTIKDLIQNSNFSQVYIISHYESSYGSFKNAQVNILCENNIVIPSGMVFNSNMMVESQ